ncbi:MAG: carboxypeptidase-like regulatory domain-containing protein [Thermoplasmata archaeon]
MRRAQRVGRAKVLMGMTVIWILMVGSNPFKVVGEEHYYITGYVTTSDGNGSTANIEISFLNIRTCEVKSTTTDEEGYYVFDATTFQQGFIEGDDVEISTSGNPFGYEGSFKLITSDDRMFLYHNIECNIMLFPSIPQPWSDTILNIHVSCRRDSNVIKWSRQPGLVYVPQSSGSIMVRAFYSCWDDGYSYFPQQDPTYNVKIDSYFCIYNKDDNIYYFPDVECQGGPFTLEYNTFWGDHEQQIDPYITIDLPYDANRDYLVIYTMVQLTLTNKWTQEIEQYWCIQDSLNGIRYEWSS